MNGVQATISMKSWILIFLLSCGVFAGAQTKPEDGGREIQLWSAGGHSVSGGRSGISVWNAGGRFGWILTAPHGPGFLKGRFEYVVDGTPVFMVFQPGGTAYGAGFSPLGLKWLLATRGNLVPYFELNGGTLFSNHDVPFGTNTVNFTDAAAFGIHVLRDSYNWSVEARYMHISNAGLAPLNSGVNTVQVRIGIGKFFRCKH